MTSDEFDSVGSMIKALNERLSKVEKTQEQIINTLEAMYKEGQLSDQEVSNMHDSIVMLFQRVHLISNLTGINVIPQPKDLN